MTFVIAVCCLFLLFYFVILVIKSTEYEPLEMKFSIICLKHMDQTSPEVISWKTSKQKSTGQEWQDTIIDQNNPSRCYSCVNINYFY